MRESLRDIEHMLVQKQYPGNLPDELKCFHAYVVDGGHSILCIPKVFEDVLNEDNPWQYEVPIPVKYVLEKGYELRGDYIVVDVEYDSTLGVVVDDKYSEF